MFAFHCPALVKECQATADIVARLPGTDKTAVEEARGESMIKAGEAIAAVSKALK